MTRFAPNYFAPATGRLTALARTGVGQFASASAVGCALLLLVGVVGCGDQAAKSYPTMPDATDPRPSAATSDSSAEVRPAAAQATSQPTGPREISFDDIKFAMEKTERFQASMLTPQINDLAGDKVRIRGYMLPSFQQTGLRQFVLVRDNQECCFGPGAALYDCVLVDMADGKSTDFNTRPIAVEGTFAIDELIGPDGRHLAIYHLDGQKVQ